MPPRPSHGGYPNPYDDGDEFVRLCRTLCREVRQACGIERRPSVISEAVLQHAPKRPLSYLRAVLDDRDLVVQFARFLDPNPEPSTAELVDKYPMVAALLP